MPADAAVTSEHRRPSRLAATTIGHRTGRGGAARRTWTLRKARGTVASSPGVTGTPPATRWDRSQKSQASSVRCRLSMPSPPPAPGPPATMAQAQLSDPWLQALHAHAAVAVAFKVALPASCVRAGVPGSCWCCCSLVFVHSSRPCAAGTDVCSALFASSCIFSSVFFHLIIPLCGFSGQQRVCMLEDVFHYYSILSCVPIDCSLTKISSCWPGLGSLLRRERERAKYYTFPALRLTQVLPEHPLADPKR